jgi:hypothetical protein
MVNDGKFKVCKKKILSSIIYGIGKRSTKIEWDGPTKWRKASIVQLTVPLSVS